MLFDRLFVFSIRVVDADDGVGECVRPDPATDAVVAAELTNELKRFMLFIEN